MSASEISPAVILVYNVSHEDVVLHLQSGADHCFDRPAFSSFQSVGESISAYLDSVGDSLGTMHADVTDAPGQTIAAGFRLAEGATDLVAHGAPSPLRNVQTRANNEDRAIAANGVAVNISALHHAGRASRGSVLNAAMESKRVVAVYFPLVVTALALWLERCAHYQCRRIVYLVSGAGSPSDPSESSEGNSTREAARLIARFVRLVHKGGLEVCTVDSGAGVFQHGANARFVNTQLRPRIMAHCERIAAHGSVEDWKQHVHVCVALTSGAPARVSALTNGLRHFEPDFIHVWRLKTFIYTHKVRGLAILLKKILTASLYYYRSVLAPSLTLTPVPTRPPWTILHPRSHARTRSLARTHTRAPPLHSRERKIDMGPSATSFASFADVETTSAVAASSADVNDEVRSSYIVLP